MAFLERLLQRSHRGAGQRCATCAWWEESWNQGRFGSSEPDIIAHCQSPYDESKGGKLTESHFWCSDWQPRGSFRAAVINLLIWLRWKCWREVLFRMG